MIKGLLTTTTLCSVLVLTACSSGGGLKKDIARIESSIQDIRAFQAEQTSRITALETRLREVTGQVEEVTYSQTSKNVTGDLESLRKDLSTIRRRVPPPPIVPVLALETDEVLVTKLPAEISRLFSNALLRIREGNFNEALPLLTEAEALSSGREWAPNLVFWNAVAHDGLADLKRALGEYHRMVQEYPKHPRSALALLRQASVFVRLHDTDTARLTLRKLMQEFPGTSEATQAKERLKKL